MGDTYTTIREIEELVVARILDLNTSPKIVAGDFDQGATRGLWKEASIPLSVVDDSHPLGHLLFNVFAESGRNTGRQRDAADGFTKITADMVVLFTYHLRPTEQIADQRLAADAALLIVRSIMALPQVYQHFDLVNAWRPALTPDGEWLLIRLDFTCFFDMSLAL